MSLLVKSIDKLFSKFQKIQFGRAATALKSTQLSRPEVVFNKGLTTATKEEPVDIQIKKRKQEPLGHTLRKAQDAVEKQVTSWNPQGQRRRGRPRETWKRTVEAEVKEAGNRRREVKASAANRVHWRSLTEALYSGQE